MVLMARKSPILTSWHSTPTKAKILAHSLEVSKKKVTSVSDTNYEQKSFITLGLGLSTGANAINNTAVIYRGNYYFRAEIPL
jgi:hypothetical protein